MAEPDYSKSQAAVLACLMTAAITLLVARYFARQTEARPSPIQQSPRTPAAPTGSTASSTGRGRGSWREANPWLARQARSEAQLSGEDWLRQHEAMEHERLRADHE